MLYISEVPSNSSAREHERHRVHLHIFGFVRYWCG